MRIALLSAVSLAAIATATAANAGSAWPNWYLGLKGSVNMVEDSDVGGAQSGKLEYDNGFGVSAALGYHPDFAKSSVGKGRIEAEYLYQKNDFDGGTIGGVSSPFIGDQGTSALMLNALYDFTLQGSRWAPYIGAGIGYAQTDVSGNLAGVTVDNDDNGFAWQLLAGLGYSPESIPYTTWTVGCRYFNAGDVKVNSSIGTDIELENTTHSLEAGVQLKF